MQQQQDRGKDEIKFRKHFIIYNIMLMQNLYTFTYFQTKIQLV